MGHLIFEPSSFEGESARKLELLAEIITQFLNDLSQKRHTHQALQE